MKRMYTDLMNCAEQMLQTNIGPFWRDRLYREEDDRFVGFLDEKGEPDYTYPVSSLLIARALWAYSVLFQTLKDDCYLKRAQAAHRCLINQFLDPEFGGFFAESTYQGAPLIMQKRIFNQAFAVIGLARYASVSGDEVAMNQAKGLYSLLQRFAQVDPGGYTDVLRRDWSIDEDARIWWMNREGMSFIFNSQLHMLEASIELLQASGDTQYRTALAEQLSFIIKRFYTKEGGHLLSAVSEDGKLIDPTHAFGTEIEAAYLMRRADNMCGGNADIATVCTTLMKQVVAEGWDREHKGFFFSYHPVKDELNRCKVWWVQAEGMVGLLDIYIAGNGGSNLVLASELCEYIMSNLVDKRFGEWRASGPNPYTDQLSQRQQADRDRRTGTEKASTYKCPYHTVRSCTEIINRLAPFVTKPNHKRKKTQALQQRANCMS